MHVVIDAQSIFSIRLSLQVACVSTVLVGLVGGTTGYIFASRNFRGKAFLEMLILLPLILPPTVIGYYLIMIIGRNGIIGNILHLLTGWTPIFSWWAAVLASFVVSLPLMIKTTQASIESVDSSMLDTAIMLGYSEREILWHITLPLAQNGILTGVVLSFARAMSEFGATLMIAGNIPGKTSTMPLTIYSFVSSGEWEKAHLLAIILTITSACFIFLTNYLAKRKF
ncbi:MAG: molybdate ABC transporter permease subunit [Oligoflexia bacterium]|nr:molybdate ABC transporter permease subunit [Oligoflexia bacterium]